MRALAFVLVVTSVGCAVRPPPVAPAHAASAKAPAGRLAGAPPALRPGVVEYRNVPALREGEPANEQHHHHHQ